MINRRYRINLFFINYRIELKEYLFIYSGSKWVGHDNTYDPKAFNLVTLNGDTLQVEKEDDLNGTSEFMIKQKNATEREIMRIDQELAFITQQLWQATGFVGLNIWNALSVR